MKRIDVRIDHVVNASPEALRAKPAAVGAALERAIAAALVGTNGGDVAALIEGAVRTALRGNSAARR